MKNLLSNLRLIRFDQVFYHETHEIDRSTKITTAIEQDGVLRNPPLALELEEDRYLLLDGAHRVKALEMLGCQRLIVQIVEEQALKLDAWQHLVPNADWLSGVESNPLLTFTTERKSDDPVAELLFDDGTQRYLYPAASPSNWQVELECWHLLVGAYSQLVPVQRYPSGTAMAPNHSEVLIRFKVCTIQNLKKLVAMNQVLPAGVTRCLIHGRLLNLGIKLDFLRAPQLNEQYWLELKNHWMRSIRFYDEPVYVLEA